MRSATKNNNDVYWIYAFLINGSENHFKKVLNWVHNIGTGYFKLVGMSK